MADKKISALTSASTPLAGTEVLPIVQSGSTVKVSVANLTAGRAVSTGALTSDSITTQTDVSGLLTLGRFGAGYPWVLVRPNSTASGIEFRSNAGDAQLVITQATGNVTFSMGNLIQGTAAKGVNFTANTPAAGMTSQLLNWYEEGTWTPVIRGSGTAGTYELSVAYGKYTRVGNQVTLTCGITFAGSLTGGGTGDLQITGLPFAKAANTSCAGAVFLGKIAFTGNLTVSTLTRGSSSSLYIATTTTGADVGTLPISAAVVNGYIDFTLTYTV